MTVGACTSQGGRNRGRKRAPGRGAVGAAGVRAGQRSFPGCSAAEGSNSSTAAKAGVVVGAGCASPVNEDVGGASGANSQRSLSAAAEGDATTGDVPGAASGEREGRTLDFLSGPLSKRQRAALLVHPVNSVESASFCKREKSFWEATDGFVSFLASQAGSLRILRNVPMRLVSTDPGALNLSALQLTELQFSCVGRDAIDHELRPQSLPSTLTSLTVRIGRDYVDGSDSDSDDEIVDYADGCDELTYLQRVFDQAVELPALRAVEVSCVHPEYLEGMLTLDSQQFCRPGLRTTVKLDSVVLYLGGWLGVGACSASGGVSGSYRGASLHVTADTVEVEWLGAHDTLPGALCPDVLQEGVLDAKWLVIRSGQRGGKERTLQSTLRLLLAQRASEFAFSVTAKVTRKVLSWQRWPPAGSAAWQQASAKHEEAVAWAAARTAVVENDLEYDSADEKYGPHGWIHNQFDAPYDDYW